ncbi:MAG: hypothetical protein SNJ77_03485 [Cytophagales bacterium]
MNNTQSDIHKQLQKFKTKYLLNELFRDLLLFAGIMSTVYLLILVGEYFGNFDPISRGLMFFVLFVVSGFCCTVLLLRPLFKLFNKDNELPDIDAGLKLGQLEPQIADKLVNFLQLSKVENENALLKAAINQKSSELSPFRFTDYVDSKKNSKLFWISLPPLLLFLSLLLFSPNILIIGANRIINFRDNFIGQAPFTLILTPSELEAVEGDDFVLNIEVQGTSLPQSVYIIHDGKRSKLSSKSINTHQFTFQSVRRNTNFKLEADGYFSDDYKLKVLKKPTIVDLQLKLLYPKYLNKSNETLSSIGNMTIPEGTTLNWKIKANHYQKLVITFENLNIETSHNTLSDVHTFSQTLKESGELKITLFGLKEGLSETLTYYFEVLKDAYPKIEAESVADTMFFSQISIGGYLSDDYGIFKIGMFFKTSQNKNFSFIPFPNNSQLNQNFMFNWPIDSLKLGKGDILEYYVAVWDNDGFNGAKMSKTNIFQLKVPKEKEIEKILENESSETSKQLEKSLSLASDLDKEMKKLQNRLKGKKNLDWEDKKAIEELVKKQQQLKNEVDKLQEKFQNLQMMNQKFTEQDQRLAEKMAQLQELMNEMLDEETQKLYEQLQKMLDEKNKEGEIKQLLEKIDMKDEVLEKELDRAMEFFKQLQFQQKLDNTIKRLDDLSKKQDELNEKSQDPKSDTKELSEQQQKLQKEFQDMKEEMKTLQEMNNDLEKKNDMPQDLDSKFDEINNEMQKASEQMQKSQKNQASKSQKNASKGMKEMSEKLSEMKTENQMKQNAENIDDLRQILDNLLTLSFDQEEIMKQFKKINQSDPKYIQLSQKQIKLKDDSKIIEDSLIALSKRAFQIRSFVVKELSDMNFNLNEATQAVKQRQPYLAAGKQQTAMTSINNLALMLSEVLDQMQQEQQSMMQGSGTCSKPNKGKPKQQGNKPNLSQLQQQLNQQMQQMMKGGKTGRELSEQLAKMAAQQEKIRKAMKDLEQMKGNDGKNAGQGKLDELKKLMEKSEEDLVNKRLNPELIKRQQDIITRLLEAENAQRERELDNKRESKTGNELQRPIPPTMEKYMKQNNKQVELLKTMPPSFSPYYKKQVNDYFQKLEN